MTDPEKILGKRSRSDSSSNSSLSSTRTSLSPQKRQRTVSPPRSQRSNSSSSGIDINLSQVPNEASHHTTFGSSRGGTDAGSRSNVETPNTQRPETEVKAPETIGSGECLSPENQLDPKQQKTSSQDLAEGLTGMNLNESGSSHGSRIEAEPARAKSGLGDLTTQLIINTTDNTLREVRIIGRPEKLFSSSMGDHTTAFAAHVGGLKLRLEKKNYEDAIKGMNELVEELTKLPGTKLVNNLPETHKAKYEDAQEKLNTIKDKLTSKNSENTSKWLDIQDYVNAYLSLRELVPLSAINVMKVVPARAGKGKGESVENLMKYERSESVNKESDSVNQQNVKKEILDNFDPQGVAIAIVAKLAEEHDLGKVAPGISKDEENDKIVEDYVQQHLNSMEVYFPNAMKQVGDVKTELINKVKDLQKHELQSVIDKYDEQLTKEEENLNKYYSHFTSGIDKTKPTKDNINNSLDNGLSLASTLKELKNVLTGTEDNEAKTLKNKWEQYKNEWEQYKNEWKKSKISSLDTEIETQSSSSNRPQRSARTKDTSKKSDTSKESPDEGKTNDQEIPTGEDKAPSKGKEAALEAEKQKQPLATQLRLDSNGHISELRSGGRSLSPFSGTMGAHTIAWIVRVDRVRTALLGKSINDAVDIVEKELLQEAESYAAEMKKMFPTEWDERKQVIEEAKNKLDTTIEEAKKVKVENKAFLLQEIVNHLLTYENYIPGSTLEVADTRGKNEGTFRKVLFDYEQKQDKKKKELLTAIEGLFDIGSISDLEKDEKMALITSYQDIIMKTYPKSYELVKNDFCHLFKERK